MDIKDVLNKINRLPFDSYERILSYVSEKKCPKGTHLFRENRRGEHIFFIKEGIARAYAQKDGKEITFWFGKEGDAIFPLSTMQNGIAEYASVELLVDSTVYMVDLKQMRIFYNRDIHIANWGRCYVEQFAIYTEKLFLSRFFKTSQEIYEEFMQNSPEIIQQVPLGIIASYLGMSQVNLSRIRAKVR